jgi:hypothetical protein
MAVNLWLEICQLNVCVKTLYYPPTTYILTVKVKAFLLSNRQYKLNEMDEKTRVESVHPFE